MLYDPSVPLVLCFSTSCNDMTAIASVLLMQVKRKKKQKTTERAAALNLGKKKMEKKKYYPASLRKHCPIKASRHIKA